MVSRTARTTIATRTRTPAKAATVKPTARPMPAPPRAAAAWAGTQLVPFHRHSRSVEMAGFHSAPFHHQKPSAENLVWGRVAAETAAAGAGGEVGAGEEGCSGGFEAIPLNDNAQPMKGVILAGGTGSRLHPLTRITNKHLLPVYDRPMISYAIEALVKADVPDIMLVTGGNHAGEFLRLLGNGEEFGVERLFYAYQEKAGGIADALSLAERFVAHDRCVVLLADNIFERSIRRCADAFRKQAAGARVVLSRESDLAHLRNLGVAQLNGDGRIATIVEKPAEPPSDFAVTGVYFYDESVWEVLPQLKPSARGELEITDVNNWYLARDLMEYDVLDGYWGDAGESIQAYYAVHDFVRARGANREP